MKPVVVIATHKRLEVTAKNLRTLLAQSVVPIIVLVCSNEAERKYFMEEFPSVTTVLYWNEPLGRKWQFGVDVARQYREPIIITGSDDILGKGFVEQAIKFIEKGYCFIGLKRWYVHDCKRNQVHLFDYRAPLPLGGGRIYSVDFLIRCNWQLFEVNRVRLLDDYGWKQVRTHAKKIIIENEKLKILSVKGDWPVMNPVEKMFNHPNAKLLQSYNPPEEILNEFI